MTDKQWLEVFDETHGEFKWFIDSYFPTSWESIMEHRKIENVTMMISLMNAVWFHLPDNKFNIIENPKGWFEFLYLIED